jgi:hypothetical protein
MPVRYEVSDDGLFVRAVASGELALAQIIRSIEAIARDDRVKPGFRELFDARDISGSSVTPDSLERIRVPVGANPKILPGWLLAIVVGHSDSYHRARRYEEGAEPATESVIVFNDIETAETWLGVCGVETRP